MTLIGYRVCREKKKKNIYILRLTENEFKKQHLGLEEFSYLLQAVIFYNQLCLVVAVLGCWYTELRFFILVKFYSKH